MTGQPIVQGQKTSDADIAELVARRSRIREWWIHDDAWDATDGHAPVGLALSGGGIRSATFALGVIQALSKSSRDALAKVDVLSTVSGGGYVGTFLRSLFVPTALRGIGARPDDPELNAKIADQYRLARHALGTAANEREIAWTPGKATSNATLRNPIWWLREHSRYLAPTGPTDYGFAIAYVARNWLAMIFLVFLAGAALGSALVAGETTALALTGSDGFMLGPIPLSPLFFAALIPVAISAALSIGYWATQAMSTNEPEITKQRANLRKALTWVVAAALVAAALLVVIAVVAPPRGVDPTLFLGRMFLGVIGGGIVVSVVGAIIAMVIAGRLTGQGTLLTTELRRRMTGDLAVSNRWLTIIVAVAAIDSAGAALDLFLRTSASGTGGVVPVLLPIVAFFIKKLPDWFGGSGGNTAGGGIGGLLKRFATTVALVIGILLYASIAIAALALVHRALWTWEAWHSDPRWWRLAVLAGVAWILAIVFGRSNGFINLSSLHSLYASRLTRAYLGASNVERLERAVAHADNPAPITENHVRDYIQPRVYGEADLPAPIHIINVTLNETIDPNSQIVARDRKGDILSLEPAGVRVGKGLVGWDTLKETKAENISLGQWVAISGAAASSAMGRMTSLGFALALTFANVRLGYWWYSPHLCPEMPVAKGASGWVARHFGTFVYLMNEMTCRYSRGYFRKYLTDGGHYENSGAYVLIRRRVPLILVTDNGADPGYDFADLESLVRQVRIDLGAEVTILGGNDLTAFLATLDNSDASIFVDPHAAPDWRAAMTDPKTPAFVLVMHVDIAGEQLHMIWVKPRVIPNLPTDVQGYAAAMKPFPQQPTGDQFFDEAQWESYRRLGEISMTRLLDRCPRLLA